jgi:uncharacterized tellurite resistance protein B-like protein
MKKGIELFKELYQCLLYSTPRKKKARSYIAYNDKEIYKVSRSIPNELNLANSNNVPNTDNGHFSNITFTMFFIAIASKLANVDGKINNNEIHQIASSFPSSHIYIGKVGKLCLQAIEDSSDATDYVSKITDLFPNALELYAELLCKLLDIAIADNPINIEEMRFIRRIAFKFGFGHKDLKDIMYAYMVPNSDNPYYVLGLKHNATKQEIVSAYRAIVKTCHPDILYSVPDVAEEYLELAKHRFDMVLDAYKSIYTSYI